MRRHLSLTPTALFLPVVLVGGIDLATCSQLALGLFIGALDEFLEFSSATCGMVRKRPASGWGTA